MLLKRFLQLCTALLQLMVQMARPQLKTVSICGGQNGIGTELSPSPSLFACQYHFSAAQSSPTCHLLGRQRARQKPRATAIILRFKHRTPASHSGGPAFGYWPEEPELPS